MTTAEATDGHHTDAARLLGVTLRRLRRERGLPQRALLHVLSLASHTTIVDFESGRRIPAPDILAAYERHFSLTPGSLNRLREEALTARASAEAQEAIAPTSARPSAPRGGRSRAPRLLPPPPRVFSGRSRETAQLSEILGLTTDVRCSVPIAVIRGTGGIGKTSLALHWAHRNSAHFPDGQLHINLRGFDPIDVPLDPIVALRAFLSALGMSPPAIPADVHAMTALYRSLTAGKRLLIILDNAYDTAQVTPLLPGDNACTALITSRHQLGALVALHGAVPVELDALDDADAYHLLLNHVGAGRVEAEPDAARTLLDACSGMPLALTILAARAAAQPSFPLAALAREMKTTATRLDLLAAGELSVNVRAVFSCSYQAVPAEAAEAFGLIGQVPGPDISLFATAALIGAEPSHARLVLRDLEHIHLLQQHAPERYRMHDLVRLYAGERGLRELSDLSRSNALIRLVDHCLQWAGAGELLLRPHGEAVDFPLTANGDAADRPTTAAEAVAWFEAEHACLLAAQRLSADRGWHHAALWLAWAMDTFHLRRGRRTDNVAAWQTALVAAEHLAVTSQIILAHRRLGHAYSLVGDHDSAAEHLHRALAIAEESGDVANQAYTKVYLAWAWELRGDNERAVLHASAGLHLFRSLGDLAWEAIALAVLRASNGMG